MEKEQMDNRPFDLTDFNDGAYDERVEGEVRATGVMDGRKLRRNGRTKQIGLKTSILKFQQLQRLAIRKQLTMTEVIENALDAYEEKLNSKA